MQQQNLVIAILDTNNIVINEIVISPIEIEVEQIGGSERSMGNEVCYQLSYYSDYFGIKRELYEYPIGIFNFLSDWEVEEGNIRIISDNINYQDIFSKKGVLLRSHRI